MAFYPLPRKFSKEMPLQMVRGMPIHHLHPILGILQLKVAMPLCGRYNQCGWTSELVGARVEDPLPDESIVCARRFANAEKGDKICGWH